MPELGLSEAWERISWAQGHEKVDLGHPSDCWSSPNCVAAFCTPSLGNNWRLPGFELLPIYFLGAGSSQEVIAVGDSHSGHAYLLPSC